MEGLRSSARLRHSARDTPPEPLAPRTGPSLATGSWVRLHFGSGDVGPDSDPRVALQTSIFSSLLRSTPLGFSMLAGAAPAKEKAKKFKAPKPKLYCKVKGSCVADAGLYDDNEAANDWVRTFSSLTPHARASSRMHRQCSASLHGFPSIRWPVFRWDLVASTD